MDPDQIKQLADLPWDLQIVLGSGYCAYRLSYVGMRHYHQTADTIFSTIAFGMMALITLWLCSQLIRPAAAIIAFGTALITGVIWRAIFRNLIRRLFSHLGYSWADETPSAWDRLHESTDRSFTQISVETEDGWQFHCTDAHQAASLPHGPCILGTSGDIIMYADETEEPGGLRKSVDNLNDPAWGAQLTYIPKDRIRAIRIRLSPERSNSLIQRIWPLNG